MGSQGKAAHPAFVPGNYPAICCLPACPWPDFKAGQKILPAPGPSTKPDRHQGRELGVPPSPPPPPLREVAFPQSWQQRHNG